LLTEQLDNVIEEHQNQPHRREPSDQEAGSPQDPGEDDPDPSDLDSPPGNSGPRDQLFEVGDPFPVQSLQVKPTDHRARSAGGRRAKTVSSSTTGRYVGARIPQGKAADLALDATLRAAAPHQLRRRGSRDQSAVSHAPSAAADPSNEPQLINEIPLDPPLPKGVTGGFDPPQPALLIEPWDVREKVRETKTGSLILFVVDASGSMGAQRRMVAVKGAILSLLLDAYQRRDRVGLISFRGTKAELLLPPTSSVDLAEMHLRDMPTGGRTPLSRGLYLALDVIETERMKTRDVLPLLVLLTDGRANVSMGAAMDEPPRTEGPAGNGGTAADGLPTAEAKTVASLVRQQRIPAVVIDTEVEFITLGLARPIAEAMAAHYLKLEDLRADSLAEAVRLQRPSPEVPALTKEEVQSLLNRLELT